MRASFAAALLGASTVLANQTHHQLKARLGTDSKPVIVQLFEWNWDAVKAECATIGQLGYTYVQVSPASEHIQGGQWWTSYQRVSSQLTSKRGNRDQFGAMVQACQNAGVGVLVDVILNHMTAGSGTGTGGTGYTQYSYNGIYSGFDFHYCNSQDRGINDWGNKDEIQNCQLAGLADLKTESSYVQDTLVNHLNDLLSFSGVAGFRIDAAKHTQVDHLRAIASRLNRNPYITSEVIGEGAPIPPSDYTSLGSVTISKSYDVLRRAFNGEAALSTLQNWESNNGVYTGSATVFVATHDTERGNVGGSVVPSSTQAFILANVFMLAYPYGTPTVLSSYKFNSVDDGAPNNGGAVCSGTSTDGANGWWCQHRWAGIAAMAKFRTAVGNAALDNWANGNANQIAFGRQGQGFVAINNDRAAWSATLSTSLSNGSYCDIVAGSKTGSSCSGAQVTVSNGQVTIRVPAKSAVAFYSGSRL